MKITPIASEFIGILASVVKMYLGYIVYIGGCPMCTVWALHLLVVI